MALRESLGVCLMAYCCRSALNLTGKYNTHSVVQTPSIDMLGVGVPQICGTWGLHSIVTKRSVAVPIVVIGMEAAIFFGIRSHWMRGEAETGDDLD